MKLPNLWRRRCRELDVVYGWVRKISATRARAFLHELDAVLLGDVGTGASSDKLAMWYQMDANDKQSDEEGLTESHEFVGKVMEPTADEHAELDRVWGQLGPAAEWG